MNTHNEFISVSTAEEEEAMLAITGKRVLLRAKHPWAGHAGTLVRWERTPFGVRPVIKLDGGDECFLMDSSDGKIL